MIQKQMIVHQNHFLKNYLIKYFPLRLNKTWRKLIPDFSRGGSLSKNMKILKKIIGQLNSFFIPVKKWKDVEYFDEKWEARVSKMAPYILSSESVMDLGCGKMTLKKYLSDNKYFPVDYIKRDADTIVCDFNKHEFPEINSDICFISGCLEYIHDYKWFIDQIGLHSKKVILSYCTTDEFPNIRMRKRNAWINHLSKEEIVGLFKNKSFELKALDYSYNKDQIFIFEKP